MLQPRAKGCPLMLKRKQTPLAQLEPRRICIIKPSALGDIIHALPVLTGLRRRFPEASITWVVNRSYEPLLQGHPDLTETLPFERGALRRGLWATVNTYCRFFSTLRRGSAAQSSSSAELKTNHPPWKRLVRSPASRCCWRARRRCRN